MNITDRIENRRARHLLKRPFIGSLAMRLELVEDVTCPTAYVTPKKMGFNPHFIESLTDPELDMLIVHEVFHLVLKHSFRRNGRDHDVWNQAGDHVINLMLVEDGMTMPECGLLDPKYKGMTTEAVYNDLTSVQNAEQSEQSGDGVPGDGQESGTPPKNLEEYGAGDVPTASEALANGTFGEVRDCPEVLDDGTTELQAERELESAITVALAQERNRGTMSGSLLAMINSRNDAHVDWTEALKNFLFDVGNNIETTWSSPNRRFIGRGDFFPNTKREGIERLIIAVDTSGSVSDDELKQFLSETMQIAEDFAPEVHFLAIDTRIRNAQIFEAGEYPDEIDGYVLGGRGGTRFEPAFRYAESMEDAPSAMIYFTDGYAQYPDEPDFPVIWAISTDAQADWGVTRPVKV